MPDPDPSTLQTIDQVIARAREAIDPGAMVWAESGAGRGVTRDRNTAALNRLALVPRVMRDVADVDPASSLVGIPLSLPVFLAPVGALALYDPDDALASARAATAMSTSAFCGILSDSTWEAVAATSQGRHFFQMYVLGDRSWQSDILHRVEDAGFAGVCVTADTPVIGRRDRSIESGFTWKVPPEGPPNIRGRQWDYVFRTRFTWPDLEWLCEETSLPVIVKGVMTPSDAVEAISRGAAAVYVSNHGGRVIDHGVSTIEVLSEIVEAVDGAGDVVVDGGFTRGAEVCMALALGAAAVGIGRLQCWGLAAGGTAALSRVLQILREEITDTMANIGCRTVVDITAEHVRWSIPTTPS